MGVSNAWIALPTPMDLRPRRPRLEITIARILVLGCLVTAAPATLASMLYKSISPTGVVQFSDTPPESGVILEERPVASSDGPSTQPVNGQPLVQLAELATVEDGDKALARANQKVDLAEHALALARRSMWSTLDGLRLGAAPPSRADEERARYYMHNVIAARQNLLATLRKREQH
jgi:hypothetical protein